MSRPSELINARDGIYVSDPLTTSDEAPTAEHWIWVRASRPPHRRIILFDYDPSRGGAVPMRLLDGFTGILHFIDMHENSVN